MHAHISPTRNRHRASVSAVSLRRPYPCIYDLTLRILVRRSHIRRVNYLFLRGKRRDRAYPSDGIRRHRDRKVSMSTDEARARGSVDRVVEPARNIASPSQAGISFSMKPTSRVITVIVVLYIINLKIIAVYICTYNRSTVKCSRTR